jgi:hypothetical protein
MDICWTLNVLLELLSLLTCLFCLNRQALVEGILPSNSISTLNVHKKMRWLLKSHFDQNHHLINHMPNGDFKSHPIFL